MAGGGSGAGAGAGAGAGVGSGAGGSAGVTSAGTSGVRDVIAGRVCGIDAVTSSAPLLQPICATSKTRTKSPIIVRFILSLTRRLFCLPFRKGNYYKYREENNRQQEP